jgi:hypothetical protein
MTTVSDAHTYQSTVLLFSSLHCGRPCVMPATVTITNNNSAAISAAVWRLLSLGTNEQCAEFTSNWLVHTSHHFPWWRKLAFSKVVSQFEVASSCWLLIAEARVKQLRLSTSHVGHRWKKQRWVAVLSMLRTYITQGSTICDCHFKCHATQNQWPAACSSILTNLRKCVRYSRTQIISAPSD